MGAIEKHLEAGPGIASDIEPEIVWRSQAAGQELSILALFVEGRAALPVVRVCDDVFELLRKVCKRIDERGGRWRKHLIEHQLRYARFLCPVPIWNCEV